MNNKNKMLLGISAVMLIVPAISESIKIRREHKAFRRQLEDDYHKDIAAVKIAHALVQERIKNGEYNSLSEVLTDMRFEEIIHREEM